MGVFMVLARRDPDAANWQFVIRPNRSLSWRETKVFFALTCAVSFTIATVFTALGAWLVFPFAGLEMLALGGALYVCALRAACYEVVTIRSGDLEVAKGRRRVTERWVVPRPWAQVRLEPGRHGWYPSQLRIVSHGCGVEVGGCLSEEERRSLAADLKSALRANGPEGPRVTLEQETIG
jgi:uncharacterized membrane protein